MTLNCKQKETHHGFNEFNITVILGLYVGRPQRQSVYIIVTVIYRDISYSVQIC